MASDSNPAAAGPGSVVDRGFQPTIAPDKLPAIYTNFVSVAGAPEELIFDFGLNADPGGPPSAPIKLSHRLVMNYYTAKRLVMAVEACLARYEKTFGVVDTNIGRRIAAHSGKTPAQGE